MNDDGLCSEPASLHDCLAGEQGCGHASDCAVHNAPALPVGDCDCDGSL